MTDHDAFEKGYDAYWEGVDVSDNPYDEETDAASANPGKRVGERPENTITMKARGEDL